METDARAFNDQKKLDLVKAEKNISLFLNMHVFKVEMKRDRIKAVIARDIETMKELRFPAESFADCTGDGTVGYHARADFRVGRETKEQTGEFNALDKPDPKPQA